MEEIISSMTTGFTTMKSDATTAIGAGVAAGIPIMGLLFAVRAGIKAFRSVSK